MTNDVTQFWPGRRLWDPLGRLTTLQSVFRDPSGVVWVDVRLGGPYSATVRYTPSMLRAEDE